MIALGGVLGGRHTPNRPPLGRLATPGGVNGDPPDEATAGVVDEATPAESTEQPGEQ